MRTTTKQKRKNIATTVATKPSSKLLSKRYKIVSLFSGCGGLDLGFKGEFKFRDRMFSRTNFDIVFANDFDADAATIYKKNKQFLGDHIFSDSSITEIDKQDIPVFDVLLAGFPCQPFSNAGKRKGINDDRGTLFYECEKIIEDCMRKTNGSKPLAFVFENVRGIMSSKMPDGTPIPEEIKKRMRTLGFETEIKLVKASDHGVPQNRYRVVMVGVRDYLPKFDFDMMDAVTEDNNLPSARHHNHDLLLGSVLCDIPKNAPQKDLYWRYSPSGQMMIDKIGFCADGKEALSKFRKNIPLEKISPTITVGRSWKNIPPEDLPPRFKKIWDDPKKYRAPNFYRRFSLGEICGTITASAQPENCGITHPFESRRFTVREAARIQSFPDDFVFGCNSVQGDYKVIGNAVPPILAWTIAKSLERHLILSNA